MDFLPTMTNMLTSTVSDATGVFNFVLPALRFNVTALVVALGAVIVMAALVGIIQAIKG